MEVSEPDVTTTINVRLTPAAEPKIKSQDPLPLAEVEFAETVVLVKPIESVPVEEPLPVVKNNKSSNSPPKWMSSSPKNNSDDNTETEGRNNEKLNLL